MPSTNTITTYHTFAPGTLIRSSYVNTNFSNYRGHLLPIDPTATSSPNLTYDLGGDGHSWMNNYSGIWIATSQSTPAANPSTTTQFKVYLKSDGSLYKLTSAGVESQLGGGGSGGGATVVWEEPANSPPLSTINKAQVYSFSPGLAQELYAEIKVPSSYVPGSQLFLKGNIYSADTSGTFLMQTVTTLLRNNTDDVSSTTNQRTSTNSAITASGANQNKIQTVNFDLMSSSGQINGVSVAAGDTILIKITRGTDTATGNIAFLHKQCEVTT